MGRSNSILKEKVLNVHSSGFLLSMIVACLFTLQAWKSTLSV